MLMLWAINMLSHHLCAFVNPACETIPSTKSHPLQRFLTTKKNRSMKYAWKSSSLKPTEMFCLPPSERKRLMPSALSGTFVWAAGGSAELLLPWVTKFTSKSGPGPWERGSKNEPSSFTSKRKRFFLVQRISDCTYKCEFPCQTERSVWQNTHTGVFCLMLMMLL